MVSIGERIAKGVAVLDQKRPGWTERVDLARLRMSQGDFDPRDPNACGCVLAQLDSDGRHAGDFYRMLHKLQPQASMTEEDAWAIEHGLASYHDEYEELTREWSRLIEARQGVVA